MARSPADSSSSLAPVLDRNIAALIARRQRQDREKAPQDRVADRVTAFTGSMKFVVIHLFLFGGWITWNLPFSPLPRFDPSLVVLAMAASVEAIFLSTFVLISQNRMNALAERRAELDLQVSLLAEHEVTQLVRLVRAVAERVGVDAEVVAQDLHDIQQDVHPENVLDRIEHAEQHGPAQHPGGDSPTHP